LIFASSAGEQDVLASKKDVGESYTYILDFYMEPCPIGVVGEIFVSAKSGNGKLAEPSPPVDPFRADPAFRLYPTRVRARYRPDGRMEQVTGPDESSAGTRGTRTAAASPPDLVVPNPIEEKLTQIWCEVIGLDEVGRNINFFDIGGHSLLATQVLSRITRVFDVELPLRVIFEAPTISELAESVSAAQLRQPQGASRISSRSREDKAQELLERLDQLSEAELRALLEQGDLNEVL
jgi:acyl carrier protein